MVEVDFLSVIICSIIFFIVSIFGYSSYGFKNLWINFSKKAKIKNRYLFYLGSFFCGLLFSYFLAFFEGYLGITSFWDGVLCGFFVWLGFILTSKFFYYLLSDITFKLFLMDNIYWLTLSMVIGGILAG